MTPVRPFVARYKTLIGNVGARIAALTSLGLATFLLARTGGPAAVGVYALLRVLPALVGVMLSSGLPGAIPYFLSVERREDRRLPLTVVAMALAGGTAGAALWAACSPWFGRVLFADLSQGLLLLSGAIVVTQVIVVTAKSCSQGGADMPGANRVIFTEQFMFLPAYGLIWAAGGRGYTALIAGLLVGDVATSLFAWGRLVRRGFFRGAAGPSLDLARGIASYGLRAQVGGVISLLNLRLDFILIGVLASPAVLGVYAIASKFAELIKIPTMAFTYVLYPRFASDRPPQAALRSRRLIPRAGLLTAGIIVPLWFCAFLIPVVYGASFRAAIGPAQIILIGLMLDGVAGVITGFLYGVGRPGLNSCAVGAGLVATLILDLLLIPRFGAVGAAIASAVAYVTSALALAWSFWWVCRSRPGSGFGDSALDGALARADTQ